MKYFVGRYPGSQDWKRFFVRLDDGRQFDVVVANDEAEIPELVELYISVMKSAACETVPGRVQGPPVPVGL